MIQIQQKNLDPGDLNVLRVGFGFLSERNCNAYKKDSENNNKMPHLPFLSGSLPKFNGFSLAPEYPSTELHE